ncbi:MAG: flavodoxin family protein, partial [Eubacteriales bacterium]|nr:flavodoxin family protein [Eubacteriales bacterium]
MSRKVLIISASPRKNSNSEALATAFAEGAKAAGNEVEQISLAGKKIEFCRGCFVCQKTQRCVIRDDADLIEQKMEQADVLVFATPIYYYEMSGQLKTMLDRGNPLYTTEYKFRDVYFLSSAAEDEEGVDARAVSGVEGWIECFPKARLAGRVFAGGVTEAGEVQGKKALEEAYERSIKKLNATADVAFTSCL